MTDAAGPVAAVEDEAAPAIARLPEPIAAQIAAGEVIERPASVVKELIENACDAGARRVRVVIEGAGLERIRVSDDGRGMAPGELELAFERHATSKLRTVADLDTLATYGFRGEALPSIAAVAEVECLSRQAGARAGDEAGARIRFEGGRSLGMEPAGAPPGTTVDVRDLFARQPARRKFLSGSRAERAAIARICSDVALARPELAITLEIDGRTLLSSPGVEAPGPGDEEALRRACAAVWGVEPASQAIAFAGQRALAGDGPEDSLDAATMRVWGLAAPPSQHRGRRGGVRLFVNRRPVESRRLVYAAEGAYAELLPPRRFPIVALFLQLDPARVDVNVHPSKATVKLRDEGRAFGLIERSLRAALLGLEPPGTEATARESSPAAPAAAGRSLRPEIPEALRAGSPDPASVARGEPRDPSPFRPRARPAFDLARGRRAVAAAGVDLSDPPASESRPDQPRATLAALPLLRLVGQLRSMFLVAEGPQGMVLIDQHAAHERVVYEQLLGRDPEQTARQELLDPALLELTPDQAAAWSAHGESLLLAGFVVEDFGDRAVRLRAVPAAMGERDARAALLAVLDDLAGAERVPPQHDPALASTACHASVRAGQTLSQDEMRRLLHDLEACENPHTCPHGRPTLIEFEASELRRRFGRS